MTWIGSERFTTENTEKSRRSRRVWEAADAFWHPPSSFFVRLLCDCRNFRLQGAEEIQQVLLGLRGQAVVKVDDGVGFGAGAGVLLNGVDQATVGGIGTAVVEEEDALADAPERLGAEFVGAGSALRDVIREPRAHVMHEQIGIQRGILIRESGSECGRTRLQGHTPS